MEGMVAHLIAAQKAKTGGEKRSGDRHTLWRYTFLNSIFWLPPPPIAHLESSPSMDSPTLKVNAFRSPSPLGGEQGFNRRAFPDILYPTSRRAKPTTACSTLQFLSHFLVQASSQDFILQAKVWKSFLRGSGWPRKRALEMLTSAWQPT